MRLNLPITLSKSAGYRFLVPDLRGQGMGLNGIRECYFGDVNGLVVALYLARV